MAGIFLKIVNMSISACWIVLAIILLRIVLKKAPKWINCVLWGLAGLRLVLPFSFESVFSLIPSAETITKTPDSPRPHIDSGVTIIDNQVNSYLQGNYFEGVTRPMGNFVDITTILAIVWIVGIAALLIHTIISFLRLKSKIGTAVLLRDNIYQSETVVSPFVLGIIKPKIYLPFNINGQDMEHVIAHEQAHISRKDHLWKPLGFLILTLHWFNPLVWLGYVLLCRDIELACDEKVVKELSTEQRADYSEALLTCSVNRKMIAACPLAFGEVGVKNRIKSVLNYKKPAFWIIIVAVIVSIVTAVCFLTDPMKKNEIQNGDYKLSDEMYFNGSLSYVPNLENNRIEIKTTGGMHIYHFTGEVLSTGALDEEVKLNKENISSLLDGMPEWSQNNDLKNLIKNNKKAWFHKTVDDIYGYPYMLLSQKDGTLYMIFADFENGEPENLRYVYKLEYKGNYEAIPSPLGSFKNPYNIGDSARIKHGDINQKDVVYDYNASITRILTGKEAEEMIKKIASNYEEEKEALESFDLYLARVHIKYNEESTVKDRLPTALGASAVSSDGQHQFIDPRFNITDNSSVTADGEYYGWFPVLASKTKDTCWISITIGTYQGAPGIISDVCFALPPDKN